MFKTENCAAEYARSKEQGDTAFNNLNIPPIACVMHFGPEPLSFEERPIIVYEGRWSSDPSHSERSVTIHRTEAPRSDLKILWAKAIDEGSNNDKYQAMDFGIDILENTLNELDSPAQQAHFLFTLFQFYESQINTNLSATRWSLGGLVISDPKKKIGRLKEAIIKLAEEYAIERNNNEPFFAMLEKEVGAFSPIIDYHRDGSLRTDTTSTRKAIDAIVSPAESQSCGCGAR